MVVPASNCSRHAFSIDANLHDCCGRPLLIETLNGLSVLLNVSVLKFRGAEIAKCRMPPASIIKALNVSEDILFGFSARRVVATMYPFGF